MIMSALYAVMLEKRFEAKAFVVAGSLYVDDKRIFGEDSNVDGQTFSKSNPSWDGHGWLAVGDFIADISARRSYGAAARVWHHRCCVATPTDGASHGTERFEPSPRRL